MHPTLLFHSVQSQMILPVRGRSSAVTQWAKRLLGFLIDVFQSQLMHSTTDNHQLKFLRSVGTVSEAKQNKKYQI
jgi:hypothetical protein